MKACGILCEYNPFHNGHIHHINETRKKIDFDVLVCVMSGNFVQRGEPAIIDKWERAKIAVKNGCDIVFELPFIYATQSATHFAQGGMQCMKLAQVSDVVFGSESNNIEVLKQFAHMDTGILKEFTRQGISSAKAYEQIYGPMNANDILGINYIKELANSTITPHTIQRTNNYHEETLNQNYSSATSIRNAVYTKQTYTEDTPMHNLTDRHHMKHYYPLIRAMLLSADSDDLKKLFLMDEGIENNLIKNARIAKDYDEFLSLCISKRYTKAKIQRTLIQLLHQTKKETVNNLPPMNTLRVLAYNEKGKQYMKQLKKMGVPIASRFNQIPLPYRQMEMKAAHIYAYPLNNDNYQKEIEKELQPPIYIR